jgi:hypothetical protein
MQKNNTQTNFVNLTGLYMSGKSAAYDYLSSHDNVFGISPHFDLDLIRLPHGINDLIFAIENLSIHNYSYAIEKFIELLYYFDGEDKNLFRKFFKYQCNYNYIFNNFHCKKESFIKLNFSSKFYCHHPHSYPQQSPLKTFYSKVYRAFDRYPENCLLFRVDKFTLIHEIKKFIFDLLISAKNFNGENFYLLNNFNHIESLNLSDSLLDNIAHVIVVRNPLDIYCAINSIDSIHNKNTDISIKINDAESLPNFLKRMNYIFSIVHEYRKKGYFVISFEDFLADPALLNEHLEDKFNLNLGRLSESSLFDPSISKKNVDRWIVDLDPKELKSLKTMYLKNESITYFYPFLADYL